MLPDMASQIGAVISLRRYPVKSMLGEEIAEARIGERGVHGDRAFALIDATTGKLASAKRPRMWGRLFEFRAALEDGDGARITFPDGTDRTSDDPDLERALAAELGREVRFAAQGPEGLLHDEDWLGEIKGEPYLPATTTDEGEVIIESLTALGAPAGTFFDFGPIHLVTTSSLQGLGAGYDDAARFRPNLVVDTGGSPGFPENEWTDRTISVGDGVVLRGTIPVPRCVMTTLAQADLPGDAGILRAAAERNSVEVGPIGVRPCLGLYADVVRGGTVRVGDPVTVE